jgi:hypothetical protein
MNSVFAVLVFGAFVAAQDEDDNIGSLLDYNKVSEISVVKDDPALYQSATSSVAERPDSPTDQVLKGASFGNIVANSAPVGTLIAEKLAAATSVTFGSPTTKQRGLFDLPNEQIAEIKATQHREFASDAHSKPAPATAPASDAPAVKKRGSLERTKPWFGNFLH